MEIETKLAHKVLELKRFDFLQIIYHKYKFYR